MNSKTFLHEFVSHESEAEYGNIITLSNEALALKRQGKTKEACELFRTVLKGKLLHGSFAKDNISATKNSLGMCLRDLKRYDEALIYFHQALKVREKEVRPKKNGTMTLISDELVTKEEIAKVHEELGNYEEAAKWRYVPICAYDDCQIDVYAKLLRCGQCKQIYYCSVACQKKDWGRHKVCCIKKE